MILKLTYWFKTLLSITQTTFMLSSSNLLREFTTTLCSLVQKTTFQNSKQFMLPGSKYCFPKFKPTQFYLIKKTAFQNGKQIYAD